VPEGSMILVICFDKGHTKLPERFHYTSLWFNWQEKEHLWCKNRRLRQKR